MGRGRSSQGGCRVLARAKINLCLHIVGRRPDCLHDLDSLVAFARFGDLISVRRSTKDISLCLERTARFAHSVPCGRTNLAFHAALRLADFVGTGAGAELRLEKRIPAGAGLGGGSADAAAVLLALRRLWGLQLGDEALARIGFGLGADVPACLLGRPARVQGAGERVEPVSLPGFWCVLTWPGYEISTADAYGEYSSSTDHGSGLPDMPCRFADAPALAAWLGNCRNDLLSASTRIAPDLPALREALDEAGAMYSSMSGSGPAHWGMFGGEAEARQAAGEIRRRQPGWWCEAVYVEGRGR